MWECGTESLARPGAVLPTTFKQCRTVGGHPAGDYSSEWGMQCISTPPPACACRRQILDYVDWKAGPALFEVESVEDLEAHKASSSVQVGALVI